MREKLSVSKLLLIVLCLELALVVISVIDYSAQWFIWIFRIVTSAVYCCWFLLGFYNRSYRVTAYFKVTALFFVLAGWFMSSNYIIYLFYEYFRKTLEDLQVVIALLYWARVATIITALILEYLSHGKVAPAVKKSWIAFLIVQLAWPAVGNTVTQYTEAQFEAQFLSAETLYAISAGVRVINLIFQLFYLWLLYRTMTAVKTKEAE